MLLLVLSVINDNSAKNEAQNEESATILGGNKNDFIRLSLFVVAGILFFFLICCLLWREIVACAQFQLKNAWLASALSQNLTIRVFFFALFKFSDAMLNCNIRCGSNERQCFGLKTCVSQIMRFAFIGSCRLFLVQSAAIKIFLYIHTAFLPKFTFILYSFGQWRDFDLMLFTKKKKISHFFSGNQSAGKRKGWRQVGCPVFKLFPSRLQTWYNLLCCYTRCVVCYFWWKVETKTALLYCHNLLRWK